MREAAGEQVSSKFASEGTTAHWVGEQCLRARTEREMNPAHYIGQTCPETKEEVTEEMAEFVRVYVDECLTIKTTADWYAVETEFTLPHISKELGGTADWSAFTPLARPSVHGVLSIRDLKYGKGVFVDVRDNPQLMIYALGALEMLRKTTKLAPLVSDINIGICQPRIECDQPTRAYTISVEELTMWQEDKLRPAVDLTYTNADMLVPGDHCHFCPALSTCPAQHNKMVEMAQLDFARPLRAPQAPVRLSDAKLAAIVQAKPMLESWLKQAEAEAQTRLENGKNVPGFKLVDKRRNRKWKEGVEPRVVKMLKGRAYKPNTLISVAEAERQLAKLGFDLPSSLYERPESGRIIAPESDKRPAVKAKDPALDFPDDLPGHKAEVDFL